MRLAIGGSWGAAGEERVWVARCFGLGAAEALIVQRSVVSNQERMALVRTMPSGVASVGNRSSLLQKNRGYKPLPQKI